MCRAHSRHLVSGNSQALDNLSKTWKLLAFYCYNLAKCKRRCSLFWLLGVFWQYFTISFQNLVSDPCEICAVVSQVTRVFSVVCNLQAVVSAEQAAQLNACCSLATSVNCVATEALFKFGTGSCGFKTQKVKTFQIDSFWSAWLPQQTQSGWKHGRSKLCKTQEYRCQFSLPLGVAGLGGTGGRDVLRPVSLCQTPLGQACKAFTVWAEGP